MHRANLSPRRRWGQNFLIDLNLMRMMIDTAGLTGNETVLEVGCGTGSMTDLLAEKSGRVIAVEIDRHLMQIAREQLQRHKNVQLLSADVLSNKSTLDQEVRDAIIKSRKRFEGSYYLISNLPYQVAAPVIINLLMEKLLRPDAMWVTVQAEVAARMTARPATKAYGPLSILLQATGQVSLLRAIKPQAFWPQPEVNSAMVSWKQEVNKCKNIRDMKQLKKMIDLLLGHRRKKIRNCLAKVAVADDAVLILEKLGINADARGETLTPELFVELAHSLLHR